MELQKKYYDNGTSQEVAEFKDGKFNGVRKYFYPNGQLWIEQTYRNGKSWTVVANYTDKGQKRDAGTLHDGNGTIIFDNEDGTARETKTYMNGDEKD
jgi:antitoxin component YwqK of YwqJK toxin-antitoxin module